MQELSITYDQILDAISRFNTIRDDLIAKIETYKSSVANYKDSGLKIPNNYETQLEAIINDLESNKNLIEEDCTRITNYLNRIATLAKDTADQSVSATEAVREFQATEVVAKG